MARFFARMRLFELSCTNHPSIASSMAALLSLLYVFVVSIIALVQLEFCLFLLS
jgi:hypothetical protein